MTPATASAPSVLEAVDALRHLVAGDVVLPGDEGWDDARRAWNLAVDQQPAAVVLAESAEDVLAAVEAARAAGLRVAPQGTGHNAAPLGDLSGTILLKNERMRGVEIDPVARRARVEAGVTWGEVVPAAADHGLAALSGSSHDVGVVGYTLGGGASFLVRKLGPAARYVVAADVVTADGRLVHACAEEEPELLWAIKGGGGAYGIVTALEFELFPITEVYGGALFFPLERAGEVLQAWGRWTKTVPDEMTSVGRILQFPPLPDIPEPLRGRSFSVLEAVYLGDEAAGAELLAPLRALGPDMDTVATIPVTGLLQLHMDPPEPVPGRGNGAMLADVTDETIRAFVAVAGAGSGSPLLSAEIRHIGGSGAQAGADEGAMVAFAHRYATFAVGMSVPPIAEAVAAHVGHVLQALEPWTAGSYMNFCEEPTDAARMFDADAHARLGRVKARYDAGDVIRANHSVAPAR